MSKCDFALVCWIINVDFTEENSVKIKYGVCYNELVEKKNLKNEK